jgi:hypothetical protein
MKPFSDVFPHTINFGGTADQDGNPATTADDFRGPKMGTSYFSAPHLRASLQGCISALIFGPESAGIP